MKTLSRGYVTIAESLIRADPWSITLGDSEPRQSPGHLDNWSYYQPIAVKITVVAEIDELLASLGLCNTAQLGLVILWVSSGTTLRGASTVVQIATGETSVQLNLDGSLLRGDLRLECQIVLVSPGSGLNSPISPLDRGSILWTTSHQVRLEGIGSRMPVLTVPFSSYINDGGHHSLWWLRIESTEMHAAADSVLWMWLNSDNLMIQKMLADGSSESSQNTQKFLKLDLYRQLIEIGLKSEDFSLDENYPSGSLGAVIAAPMSLLGQDLNQLRARYEGDPQEFQASVQALLGGL